MGQKYPKTTRELLDWLKAKQDKKDQKTLDLVAGIERAVQTIEAEKADPTARWPKQYARLEYNGKQVRSIVAYYCDRCYSGGVAASQFEDGSQVSCWHCDLCRQHCDYQIVSV